MGLPCPSPGPLPHPVRGSQTKEARGQMLPPSALKCLFLLAAPGLQSRQEHDTVCFGCEAEPWGLGSRLPVSGLRQPAWRLGGISLLHLLPKM